MRAFSIVVIFLFLLVVMPDLAASKKRRKGPYVYCRPKTLVRYKLSVTTEWTRESFPRMYPTVRPHAQWSTLVGASHNQNLTVWREGEHASKGVKEFAEVGNLRHLQAETAQNQGDILDAFTAPAIDRGQGQTSALFYVDATRPQVSFLMKLIPSPDWFIGVSSLDLCRKGRWRNHVHIDLGPMDAGTDQGMTFTAPNWPNDPFEPISTIRADFPNNDANSFFYPDLKELPRMASVDLQLLSEYRLRKAYVDVKRSPKDVGTMKTPAETKSEPIKPKLSTERLRDEEIRSSQTSQFSKKVENDKKLPNKSDAKEAVEIYGGTNGANEMKNGPTVLVSDREVAEPPFDVSPDTYKNLQFEETRRLETQEFHPEDCIVSDWSVWSPCTKTCGFGEKERTRAIIRFPVEHGLPCPPLRDQALCGSMRTCNRKHFSFLDKNSNLWSSHGQGIGTKKRRRKRKPLNKN